MTNKPIETVGLNTKASSHSFMLNVNRPLVGVPGSSTVFQDQSGKLRLSVPSEMFPWAEAGDVCLVTIAVSKTTIETANPSGLELPNARN